MSEAIGFLGLGRLGLPMAMNLVAAGYSVRAFNRTAEKAAPLVAKGATLAKSAVDAVTPGGIVVSVLWDDPSVEDVIARDGFLEKLGRGGVHVAMSTISPEGARRFAEMHEKHGCSYVEATVFGRPEAAAAKKLVVPYAGPRAAKDRVRPILTALGAERAFDFGETIGAATMAKIAGNFMIVSAARTIFEAAAIAEKNGVERKALVDMMTTTLFDAPIYRNYGKAIIDGAPPMQSPIPLKDVGLFVDAAENKKGDAPIANRLLEMLKSTATSA